MSGSRSQDATMVWTDLGTALGGHFEALGQSLSSAIANGCAGALCGGTGATGAVGSAPPVAKARAGAGVPSTEPS